MKPRVDFVTIIGPRISADGRFAGGMTTLAADEAAALRAIRRYKAPAAARDAGNAYSERNRVRQLLLRERLTDGPRAHQDRKEAQRPPPPRKGLHPRASQRAVAVPRVGVGVPNPRPAAVDLIPQRKPQPDYEDWAPAPLAPYMPPPRSREALKEDFVRRLAGVEGDDGDGKRPLKAPLPRQLGPVEELEDIGARIAAEIDERLSFLDEMRLHGAARDVESEIRADVADRRRELERVQRLLAAEGKA